MWPKYLKHGYVHYRKCVDTKCQISRMSGCDSVNRNVFFSVRLVKYSCVKCRFVIHTVIRLVRPRQQQLTFCPIPHYNLHVHFWYRLSSLKAVHLNNYGLSRKFWCQSTCHSDQEISHQIAF